MGGITARQSVYHYCIIQHHIYNFTDNVKFIKSLLLNLRLPFTSTDNHFQIFSKLIAFLLFGSFY